MKNKWLIILTVVLGVLVVMMGSYIIYENIDKEDNIIESNNDNENEPKEETINYTYSDIKGYYVYIGEPFEIEGWEDAKFSAFYKLRLYENGTFTYRMGTMSTSGYVGNYIIEDNNIKLNYLFSLNNGAGLTVTEGSKIITITDKDTLVDINQSIDYIDMESVTLTRESEDTLKDYEEFQYLLNNYGFVNNESKKQYNN